MQVNRVNTIQNKVNFKSNIFDSVESFSNNLNKEDTKKILLGLAGLAVLGATAVTVCLLKKKNIDTGTVKNAASEIRNKHPKKPKQDSIYKHLDGLRDKEAVKIYKAYQARAKIASLEKRSNAGEFIGKPAALEYANINYERLQRVAKGVI